jgi:hypothetical protein
MFEYPRHAREAVKIPNQSEAAVLTATIKSVKKRAFLIDRVQHPMEVDLGHSDSTLWRVAAPNVQIQILKKISSASVFHADATTHSHMD